MTTRSALRTITHRTAVLSALVWIFTAAISAHAIPVPVDDPGSPPPTTPPGSGAKPYVEPMCRTVTVKGRVFYNDLRRNGRFSLRTNQGNTKGTAEPWTAKPKPGDNANYLGLLDGTVRIYEYDRASGIACQQTSYVGTAIIQGNGEYSWHGEVCDSCAADGDGTDDKSVSIVAQVSLENCTQPDSRCFSVRDPKGAGKEDHYNDKWDGPVYARWLKGAEPARPHVASRGEIIDLGDDYFQTERAGQVPAHVDDMPAQAANVFASMVDVTRKIHPESKVPFDHAKYGEIKAFFPSVIGKSTGGAHSHQAGRLCIGAPQIAATYKERDFQAWLDGPRTTKWTGGTDVIGDSDYEPMHPEDWVDGGTVAHEYGHLVHYWAWGGVGKWASFCMRDADCDESTSTKEFAQAAFKEGWADFIRRVTYNDEPTAQQTCATADIIEPLGCTNHKLPLCGDGRYYITDVRSTVCDMWDSKKDVVKWGKQTSDPGVLTSVTYTDTAQAGIFTLRSALVKMWDEASGPEKKEIRQATAFDPKDGKTATTTLGLCRFAQALIGGTQTKAAVESALAVNGIECNLD
ncbi:MAG: hypothetical protein ABI612_13485 [Betaproteobacteria bacterium]